PPSEGPGGAPRTPRGHGELVARAIVGEMGIGKTALVSTFLGEIPSETSVLQVECSPVKSELPLATVGDLLRVVTGMGIDHSLDDAEAALRGLIGAIGKLP